MIGLSVGKMDCRIKSDNDRCSFFFFPRYTLHIIHDTRTLVNDCYRIYESEHYEYVSLSSSVVI